MCAQGNLDMRRARLAAGSYTTGHTSHSEMEALERPDHDPVLPKLIPSHNPDKAHRQGGQVARCSSMPGTV